MFFYLDKNQQTNTKPGPLEERVENKQANAIHSCKGAEIM